MRAVQATVIDKSTIEVQCRFILGSDALGCRAVLKRECPSVADLHLNISRSVDMTVSKMLVILHNAPCFNRVFAYDIDVNHTISTLSINGEVNQSLCTGEGSLQ